MITIWVVLGDGSAACTNMEGGENKIKEGVKFREGAFSKITLRILHQNEVILYILHVDNPCDSIYVGHVFPCQSSHATNDFRCWRLNFGSNLFNTLKVG